MRNGEIDATSSLNPEKSIDRSRVVFPRGCQREPRHRQFRKQPMKRKIIIGLVVCSAVFLVCGVYIVFAIESSKSRLHQLITLHQVEFLREHYFLQIKNVQSALLQRRSELFGDPEPFEARVRNIGKVMDTCFGCHHSREISDRLDGLKRQTEEYQVALRKVSTNRSNPVRILPEEKNAFGIGEELTRQMSGMIAMTYANLEEKTHRALDEISETMRILYLLMVVVPVLCSIAVYGVIKSLTEPVGVLLESTRRLKGGDLDHRVEGLKDEFKEIGTSFNEMADSLKGEMQRLLDTQDKLTQSNRQLELAREKMVKAETMAALGTLSAGISHELSTPLSIILNMTELIKQDVGENPALAKDLEIIEDEAGQAITITRSLLGFAKSAKTKIESVDVNEILEDLFRILEIQPRGKSIRLVKELDPDLAPIRAGAVPIRQVFLNIILNSVNAMPDGGELRVATRNFPSDRPDSIHVAIGDTGVGIPQEHRKKIFQPFFTTKEEGTGLGLAICQGIVQEHNGRIEVESEVGKGTTFHVFLPRTGKEEAV